MVREKEMITLIFKYSSFFTQLFILRFKDTCTAAKVPPVSQHFPKQFCNASVILNKILCSWCYCRLFRRGRTTIRLAPNSCMVARSTLHPAADCHISPVLYRAGSHDSVHYWNPALAVNQRNLAIENKMLKLCWLLHTISVWSHVTNLKQRSNLIQK